MKAPDVISINRSDEYPHKTREKNLCDLKKGQEVELNFSEKRQRYTTYIVVSLSPYYIKLKRKNLIQK